MPDTVSHHAVRTHTLNASFPLLKRFVLFIFLPVLLLLAAVWHHFRSALPEHEPDRTVAGLAASVKITRDAQGVPHIKAGSDRDVFFAMGYVHAQDRLWQLEVQRRTASGRLAEVFGREALQSDVWLRTLGLHAAARTSWPALSREAQDSLRAYTEGINSWLAANRTLPPEFVLMGVKPEPWTVYDSLAWVKVFSLSLSGNFDREISRYLAAQTLTGRELATFFPGSKEGGPVTVQAPDDATRSNLAAVAGLQRALEASFRIGGKHVGSNAWAVSGKWTRDGAAVLANDPHLGLQVPSQWYPVSQEGDRLKSSGMSLVGLPLVIFGQNSQIAWGSTNMLADTQDIYVEQVNPNDPNAYRAGDGWEPFTVREELIHVKAAFPAQLRRTLKPVAIKVRGSRHGPIISDAVGLLRQPIALRWTALDAGDTTYESFLQLGYARNWNEFTTALQSYVSPALNMVYADRRGNIGYQGVGRIPLRARGDGALPAAGWAGDAEWTGFIPFERMPRTANPASGYIVSANNKVVGDDYPYFISHDWAPPGRAQRIVDLLETARLDKDASMVEHFKRMQADVVSLPAVKMVPLLTALAPRNARQAEALGYLKHWNGAMDADSQAATIFNVWMKHLGRSLFSERLRIDWNRRDQSAYLESLVAGASVDQLHAALADPDSPWCARAGQDPARACRRHMADALDEALAEIARVAGSDMASWRWGSVHEAYYAHTPFSKVKFLDTLFERRVPSGGSADTINVANATLSQSKRYQQTIGATFRQIIALAPQRQTHLYMNSIGQSGNVFSQHYANMVKPFHHAGYLPLDRQVPAADAATITLSPQARANQEAKR